MEKNFKELNENEQINKYIQIPTSSQIDQYTTAFSEKKIVKIKPILSDSFAEELFKTAFLEKKWNFASGVDNIKFEKPLDSKFDKANHLQIKNINTQFKKDKFTYMFHRSMNNKNPSYMEYLIRTQLNSPEMIQMINTITNLGISKVSTMFLSKYKSNHFLNPHSDKGNGKLAFVLNLSKFWKAQYGGILHFLDEERNEIIDSYVPDFNNLVLFEVPEDQERPHFVSHIAPYVKHNRYAITGWYS